VPRRAMEFTGYCTLWRIVTANTHFLQTVTFVRGVPMHKKYIMLYMTVFFGWFNL